MINWEHLEEHLKIHHFYNVDNKASRNIVLFGNCHLLPLTFYLNRLFKHSYNFIVIISWFYEKSFNSNDLAIINKEILSILSYADIFIFQKHYNNFGIHANEITHYVNKKCKLINIPNFMIDYILPKSTSSDVITKTSDMTILKAEFNSSLFRLSQSILESDFQEFSFVTDNIYKVRFFNTPYHPTHFLLYLLSKSVYSLLMNNPIKITIGDYYDKKTRDEFLNIDITDLVFLPGKIEMNPTHHEITGFHYNADYFDIMFVT